MIASQSSPAESSSFWAGRLRTRYRRNSETYEGSYLNNQRNGFGNYKFNDGQEYIGEFKNDNYDGFGTLFLNNGDVYEGEFKNGLFNGIGKYTYTNGIIEEGSYVDGIFLASNSKSDNLNLVEEYSKFLISITPVIPHLSSECLGQININNFKWPQIEEKFLIEEDVNIVVQINGKKRGIINTKKDISEEKLMKLILDSKSFDKFLKGNKIKKHIYVKNRLINFLV